MCTDDPKLPAVSKNDPFLTPMFLESGYGQPPVQPNYGLATGMQLSFTPIFTESDQFKTDLKASYHLFLHAIKQCKEKKQTRLDLC
jgi:hypothetical protein